MHSNTRVFYIRIEILLTDINYMYYLYTVFVCAYVYTTVYNLFCVYAPPPFDPARSHSHFQFAVRDCYPYNMY